jgi:tetrapyrrole methylase family protein/MazG family protein
MINLVGLGPGGAGQVTLDAMDALERSDVIFVRGGAHHAVPKLLRERGKNVQLLGALYHIGMRHAEVYDLICDIVMTAARLYATITYAVPGNIFVFETACQTIRDRAEREGVPLRLVPGLSSIEAMYALLGIDPGEGLAILDGALLHEQYSPRVASVVLQAWDKLDPNGAARFEETLRAHLPATHPITIVADVGSENMKKVEGTIGAIRELTRGFDPDWSTCYVPRRT